MQLRRHIGVPVVVMAIRPGVGLIQFGGHVSVRRSASRLTAARGWRCGETRAHAHEETAET